MVPGALFPVRNAAITDWGTVVLVIIVTDAHLLNTAFDVYPAADRVISMQAAGCACRYCFGIVNNG